MYAPQDWKRCTAAAWTTQPYYLMLLQSYLSNLSAQKSLFDNSRIVTIKSVVMENKVKADTNQQRDHPSFCKWAGGETSAELQEQTKEPIEQTKNIWSRDTTAPSASVCSGNGRVGNKSVFWAVAGLFPEGILLSERRPTRRNYPCLLKKKLTFQLLAALI